jgi:hypothetical protein
LWLVDETAEIVEVRSLQGDRYGEGNVYARAGRLESVLNPELMIEVNNIFED